MDLLITKFHFVHKAPKFITVFKRSRYRSLFWEQIPFFQDKNEDKENKFSPEPKVSTTEA